MSEPTKATNAKIRTARTRTRFRVVFEDFADPGDAPPHKRLALLLKIAGRRLSLKCLGAEQRGGDAEPPDAEPPADAAE